MDFGYDGRTTSRIATLTGFRETDVYPADT